MKRFVAGLAVVAAWVLAMAPTPIAAAVRQVTEVYYYSDATYTVEVGYMIIYCNGTTYSEGQKTTYQQRYYMDWCAGGSARQP